MFKKLKIIIAAVTISTIVFITFIMLPNFVTYNPPSPNIIKTDQGSFELKITNRNIFNLDSYQEYETAAKDYYFKILPFVKNKNLIISTLFFESSGEGTAINHFDFWIVSNDKQYFKARYFWNKIGFKTEYKFYGFELSVENSFPKYITLEELLKTPEYQNLKLN